MREASRDELKALAFCFEDTATQIRESIAEARDRGLRAPTEEEKERLRFDLALSLAQSTDPARRAMARVFLRNQRGVA